jgi:hypothetical protein
MRIWRIYCHLADERPHKRWPVKGTRGKTYAELLAIVMQMNVNPDGERFFIG